MRIDECPYNSLKPRAVFKIWKDTKSLFLTILFSWWMDNILRANCYPLSIYLQVPEAQGKEQNKLSG